jgi:hypothetical protein
MKVVYLGGYTTMSINRDRYDRIHYKSTEEDNFIDEDIFDEIFDDDIEEDNTSRRFSRDKDKRRKDYSHKEEIKISVNCKLKVDFDTKNKMIYLHPGKSEFFTVDVSKCCGDVTIKYNGCYSSSGIHGNLARYRIVESGIIAETYSKLDPRKKDFLKFTAIDECTKERIDFIVVFSSNLCGCC